MIPQDRTEQYYAAILGAITGEGEAAAPSPVWRKEEFLAAILAAAKGEEPSIPDPVWRDEAWLALIAQAISEGGGGGGTTVEPKDVNFIDYDGTIVAAYTAEEFAALDALPANPTHEGLTAQGWNWSLSDAKTYVAAYGKLWVGQMYVTDDGKTRVYIKLDGGALSPTLRLAVDGSAVIDWGDESVTDTLTGSDTTTAITVQHTYAASGDYVISIDVTGEAAIVGAYNYPIYNCILGGIYGCYIKKIEIGTNVVALRDYALAATYTLSSVTIPSSVTSIGGNAFSGCYALSSATIPNSVTSIGDKAFQNCHALTSVAIPSGVTSIGPGLFYYCYTLSYVAIPSGVTSIGKEAFDYCYALSSVAIPSGVTSIGNNAFYRCMSIPAATIPDGVTAINANTFYECSAIRTITIGSGVTSIGNSVFYNCYSLTEIHVKPTTPPTLGLSVFYNVPATCVIYVPSASLETYKTASNWSTYASQMVGE